nr:hypothetical protein GCM10020092_053330 [Actinoplanes digitatis]
MERISYTLSNGMVSSQHTASTLALFIALHEMYFHGREYASRVVESSRYLAAALHDRGVPMIAADRGFTRNHMSFIDNRPLGAGPALLERLLRAGIAVNRSVAFEQTDTMRLGVQEVVRRGFTNADFDLVADWLAQLLLHDADPGPISLAVADLVGSRNQIKYCEPEHGLVTEAVPRIGGTAAISRPAAPSTPVAAPRWADIQLRREPIEIDHRSFDGARSLG